jgi:hypothetical protein
MRPLAHAGRQVVAVDEHDIGRGRRRSVHAGGAWSTTATVCNGSACGVV